MKFLTFKGGFGALIDDDTVIDLAGYGWSDLSSVANANAWSELHRRAAALAQQTGGGRRLSLADLSLRPPLPRPGKILCVGVNYPDRNAEYQDGSTQPPYMSLFPRFISSFVGAGESLVRPPESAQLDYEGEIALVIGQGGRRIPRDRAYAHIAGITLCNEGTIRDWVRHAKFNVTQGKNWDRSGAMGPWIVPFEDRAQIDGVALTTRVNGELRQEDNTARMLFSFADIIAYISTFTRLEPGDILVTGTPTGAGARLSPPVWLKPGDRVEVAVPGIGVLSNGVSDEVIG